MSLNKTDIPFQERKIYVKLSWLLFATLITGWNLLAQRNTFQMGLDAFTFENIVFLKICFEIFQTYWAVYLFNIGCKFQYRGRFILVSPYTVENE